MKGTALLPSTWGLTIWFGEKIDMQGTLNTQCRAFIHAAEGPFLPMLDLTSIHTVDCHCAAAVSLVLHKHQEGSLQMNEDRANL